VLDNVHKELEVLQLMLSVAPEAKLDSYDGSCKAAKKRFSAFDGNSLWAVGSWDLHPPHQQRRRVHCKLPQQGLGFCPICSTFSYIMRSPVLCLQCFDTVGWATGRASGL